MTARIDKEDGRSLRSGFLHSARTHPQAIGLHLKGRDYSYAELEDRARRWAAAIVEHLGRPARRVGVYASRSETSYVGVMASLFSGAAFVPLNPAFPVARSRQMIRRADVDAVIIDASGRDHALEVCGDLEPTPLLLLPESEPPAVSGATALGMRDLETRPPLRELPAVLPDDVAYLLFTSGSTGEPKGVPVTHRNVCYFIDYIVDRYAITSTDSFSQTFDQTFDLSIFDIFAAWQRGARVCSMQSLDLLAPARFVQKHELTIWFSVPSVPVLMLKKGILRPGSMPTLRYSLFCGEPLTRSAAEGWQHAAPHSIVENLYGPTELTIACLLHRWDPATSPARCVNDVVPIGRPFPGLGAVLLDDELRPTPPGEAGELCICGPQAVPGYWRDPAKTSERFISLAGPIPDSDGMVFYRTGDRVTQLDNGEYAFIGRVDNQIKLRGGYRVELGEIEAVMRRYPGVAEAVALGWPVQDGIVQGVTVFATAAATIDPEAIKMWSRTQLPSYMAVTEIRIEEQLPLNANGKIDRKALRAMLERGSERATD